MHISITLCTTDRPGRAHNVMHDRRQYGPSFVVISSAIAGANTAKPMPLILLLAVLYIALERVV